MSQPKIRMAPPPQKPLTRDSFVQNMSVYKRRISQTKGEVFDGLNDRINSEMQNIYEDCMEVFSRLELAEAENIHLLTKVKELGTKLEKYEPTKGKQIQKTEKVDVSDYVTKGLNPPK